MADGLKGSIWAAVSVPSTHDRPRRWQTPPLNEPTNPRTSSQPPSFSPHPPAAAATNIASTNGSSISRHDDFQPTYRPPAPSKDILPSQALHRLEQTCLRLRWKSIDLEASYSRVLNAADYNFPPGVAERNFKIDFYEFYAWIEQAVELLHRVFGVQILSIRTHPGSGYGGSSHAFHHNVLKALEDESNPLHEVMGKGEVNAALWKAKELRNRWKEGGEDVPMGMYDLKWIVGRVLEGLEGGYVRARELVELEATQGKGMNEDAKQNGGGESWEWMVSESMDLDEDVG